MSLTTEGMTPADIYACTRSGSDNGGFGGDWGWIILLLLFANGGWGMGGFGGAGNMMLGYDFPWLMTGQQGINNNTNVADYSETYVSDFYIDYTNMKPIQTVTLRQSLNRLTATTPKNGKLIQANAFTPQIKLLLQKHKTQAE